MRVYSLIHQGMNFGAKAQFHAVDARFIWYRRQVELEVRLVVADRSDREVSFISVTVGVTISHKGIVRGYQRIRTSISFQSQVRRQGIAIVDRRVPNDVRGTGESVFPVARPSGGDSLIFDNIIEQAGGVEL